MIADPQTPGWEPELTAALGHLGPGPYAVRSSAAVEDGDDASYAGQFHTSLNVPATGVAHAVARSVGSHHGPAARAYAAALGRRAVGTMSVIVQRMIEPEAAGLAFTRHPVTGAEAVVIEAAAGLGDQVVAGLAAPQRWVVRHGVATADRAGRVLTCEQALALAGTALRVEELFGRPQDIEWAIAAGTTWLLQSRPITGAPRRTPGAIAAGAGAVLTTGTPASPGAAAGPVRVIRDLDDFERFRPGDVLVCRATSPAWTPPLTLAAAVVTETGGLLAHAAIVARELGIPAVTDATEPMSALSDDQVVVVDGATGAVTALVAQASRR